MDGHDDVNHIVDSLSDDQRTIMENLERVRKSDSNTFHEKNLQKRKRCWNIDVSRVLKELAILGLVHRVNRKGCWRTTKPGRKVEHRVYDEAMVRRYPFPVRRV